jgi:hypothetical protein
MVPAQSTPCWGIKLMLHLSPPGVLNTHPDPLGCAPRISYVLGSTAGNPSTLGKFGGCAFAGADTTLAKASAVPANVMFALPVREPPILAIVSNAKQPVPALNWRHCSQ